MIPESIDIDGVWNVLPPGIHDATLDEIEERFATNDKRKRLFLGFKKGLETLGRAGCRVAYLDGSFVTDKDYPGDFDVCWEPVGVKDHLLDRVFLEFEHGRISQKLKYDGEFFPSTYTAGESLNYLQYFQLDRDTGKAKGIIRIQL